MNNATTGGIATTMDPGIMNAAWYNPGSWFSTADGNTSGSDAPDPTPSGFNWTGLSIVAIAAAAVIVVLAIKF